MTDWYNDVPAPMDADGEIVPLGVKELYTSDGDVLDVELIGFNGRWVVKFDTEGLFNLDWFHLFNTADSLEKLADDLKRYVNGNSCSYFGVADAPTCNGCPANDRGNECGSVVIEDAARRAKALVERDTNDSRREVKTTREVDDRG